MFTELARLATTNSVQALALATGGNEFPFTRERGLENAVEKLGAEIHSQYILGFEPDAAQSGAHRIEVSVPNQNGKVRIRSRQGYWQD